MMKTYNNTDSNSYEDVHEKPIIIWIIIHTEMCMTKAYNNMDSNSYRDVHD